MTDSFISGFIFCFMVVWWTAIWYRAGYDNGKKVERKRNEHN